MQNNRQAAKSNALIVYNTRNGNLFYNANGSRAGFGEGGNFALLSGKPAMTAAHFLVQF
ncbi:hypothetical protein HJG54_32070 [Leptolyngbya sp. NK1-12]|uniref:Uncharacterized protein n=1 Tax=Leptolyngbya sp. NK1-12 TaxID=2547451 RepID=A0AA96WLQ4_9CYAN|nr:hypothetical protein [Leptolyngbya sp. NK1-12]WNZ27514.1 hypothetical protein HJG54_32070 [Leptolyngbya sp. NK1-12]